MYLKCHIIYYKFFLSTLCLVLIVQKKDDGIFHSRYLTVQDYAVIYETNNSSCLQIEIHIALFKRLVICQVICVCLSLKIQLTLK